LIPVLLWIEILETDGDLRLNCIDGAAVSFAGTWSATPVG
jgi:hypothetical protein